MLAIDTSRRDLCEEFKRSPVGGHSPDLQKLLLLMRWGNARGRTIIVCTIPDREWRLGRMGPKRGAKMTIDTGRSFHSHGEAEWACFRARWREMTGAECPVE